MGIADIIFGKNEVKQQSVLTPEQQQAMNTIFGNQGALIGLLNQQAGQNPYEAMRFNPQQSGWNDYIRTGMRNAGQNSMASNKLFSSANQLQRQGAQQQVGNQYLQKLMGERQMELSGNDLRLNALQQLAGMETGALGQNTIQNITMKQPGVLDYIGAITGAAGAAGQAGNAIGNLQYTDWGNSFANQFLR